MGSPRLGFRRTVAVRLSSAVAEGVCPSGRQGLRSGHGRGDGFGERSQPAPDDPPGRAMHLVAVLRELRGSAHLLAVRAVGLDVRLAHQIKRGEQDAEMFGWQAPHLEISDADRSRHDEAERLTDAILQSAFAALDDGGAAALVTGIERIEAAVTAS